MSLAVVDQVLEQLTGEFPPDATAWVRDVPWSGPQQVPLDSVDDSNREDWVATREPERVQGFVESLERDGELPPVILYETPDFVMHIADGHHRWLAYEQLGMPAVAYVAEVPTDAGPWAEMHSQGSSGPSLAGPASGPGPAMGAWARRANEPGE